MTRVTLMVGTLSLTWAAAALGAPVVVAPDKVVDIDQPSEYFFDVGVSGASGEDVAGYFMFFDIVAQPGSTGGITLNTGWAVEHPVAPLFPGSDPSENNAPILVTDALIAGYEQLQDSKYFFRALLDIAPGTSGVFTIEFDSFSEVQGPSEALTFTDGSITVVPEPAAVGMFGMVGSVLALRRRRRV